MKEKRPGSRTIERKKNTLALSIAAVLSVSAAFLLRIFLDGAYLRLISSGTIFLCFAIFFAVLRPVGKIGFQAQPVKPLLGSILALSAVTLLAIPLLILGDAVGYTASYTPYTPFTSENAPPFLPLLGTNALLPMLLFELAGRKFCLPCFLELFETSPSEVNSASSLSIVIPSLLTGGLFALWQGESLRLPAFMLFGTALSYVAIMQASMQVTLVFSLLFGALLQAYEAYIYAFGVTTSLPSPFQAVGMLLIFAAIAIPAWQYGVKLISGTPRPRGWKCWLPLLISAILLISGCAITGSAG